MSVVFLLPMKHKVHIGKRHVRDIRGNLLFQELFMLLAPLGLGDNISDQSKGVDLSWN